MNGVGASHAGSGWGDLLARIGPASASPASQSAQPAPTAPMMHTHQHSQPPPPPPPPSHQANYAVAPGLYNSPYGVTAYAPSSTAHAPAPPVMTHGQRQIQDPRVQDMRRDSAGEVGNAGTKSPMRPEWSPISRRASPAMGLGLGISGAGANGKEEK